jgi:hypothetical protein
MELHTSGLEGSAKETRWQLMKLRKCFRFLREMAGLK